jgi:hypothetical protein
MTEVKLLERTQEFLRDPLLGEQDIDAKIRQLLAAEYMRRVGHYRRVDHNLMHKYGVSFDEFIAHRVSAQQGYSWEVEKDAMDWETAIGGILTIERRLRELRELEREQSH